METIRLHDLPTPKGFLSLVAVGLVVAGALPAVAVEDAEPRVRVGAVGLGLVLGAGVAALAWWPPLRGPRVVLGPERFTLGGHRGGSWAWSEFEGVRLVSVPRGGGTVVALTLREPRGRAGRLPRWLRRGLTIGEVTFGLNTLDVPPGVSLLPEIDGRIAAAADAPRTARENAADP